MPLRVACPSCGQPAGKPCLHESGRESMRAHPARKAALNGDHRVLCGYNPNYGNNGVGYGNPCSRGKGHILAHRYWPPVPNLEADQ